MAVEELELAVPDDAECEANGRSSAEDLLDPRLQLRLVNPR
jgi:hypothetical protein